MLLKISRDKAYEQFIKTEKGKITHRIREIRDRHKNAFDVQVVEKTVMRVMLNGLYHQIIGYQMLTKGLWWQKDSHVDLDLDLDVNKYVQSVMFVFICLIVHA